MEVNHELQGAELTIKDIAKMLKKQEKGLQEGLEYVLRLMVNHCKQNVAGRPGAFKDHTGHLRNSISGNLDTMRLTPAGSPPPPGGGNPVVKVEGDDYLAVLSAGMEYAVYVERTEGYWVLTGAIDLYTPQIQKHLKKFISVEKIIPEKGG